MANQYGKENLRPTMKFVLSPDKMVGFADSGQVFKVACKYSTDPTYTRARSP
jgi:hypothetical protein